LQEAVTRSTATAAQEDAEMARLQWRQVADQLRPKVVKLATLMNEAEADVLAFMSFPKDHRPKIHSTNPLAPRAWCRKLTLLVPVTRRMSA
jgi:transposase-like protein